MAIIQRPARATDQAAITALIHLVGINPMNLDWPRFLLLEDDTTQQIVACGQLKPHSDCLELASIAVTPTHQGQGLGSQVVTALLAQAPPGPLYLTCQGSRQPFYARWGFVAIKWADLPGSFRPVYVIGGLLSRLFLKPADRVSFMRRAG